MGLLIMRSYKLRPRRPGLVLPAHVERPPFYRGGSVNREDRARPLFPSPLKPLSDKNRKGGCYALTARMHRSPLEVRGARAQEHDSRPSRSSRLFYFPNAFFSSGSISPLAAIGSRMSVS